MFDGEEEGWEWELGAYEEVVAVTSMLSSFVEFGDPRIRVGVAVVEELTAAFGKY